MNKLLNKGFTLIELIVTIAIIAVLSAVVLFSVTQYISKSKDANLSASLAILIPAGEAYYNANNNSYGNFCDPTNPGGSTFKNILSQMPTNTSGICYSSAVLSGTNPAGVCCNVQAALGQYWAACAKKFADATMAWCVDSRGVKKDISIGSCSSGIISCN